MIENQAHFIVSCPQYDVRRAMLWEKLQGVIPITIVTSLKHLPTQQFAALLSADTVGGRVRIVATVGWRCVASSSDGTRRYEVKLAYVPLSCIHLEFGDTILRINC